MPAPDASGMTSPHSGQSGTSPAEGSGPSLSKSATDSDDYSAEKSYQTSPQPSMPGRTGTGTSAERTGTSGDTPLDDPSAYSAEGQAQIRLGAGVEQQDHVQAAEDLQDFRREREGHLYVLFFKFYFNS